MKQPKTTKRTEWTKENWSTLDRLAVAALAFILLMAWLFK